MRLSPVYLQKQVRLRILRCRRSLPPCLLTQNGGWTAKIAVPESKVFGTTHRVSSTPGEAPMKGWSVRNQMFASLGRGLLDAAELRILPIPYPGAVHSLVRWVAENVQFPGRVADTDQGLVGFGAWVRQVTLIVGCLPWRLLHGSKGFETAETPIPPN